MLDYLQKADFFSWKYSYGIELECSLVCAKRLCFIDGRQLTAMCLNLFSITNVLDAHSIPTILNKGVYVSVARISHG